MRGTHYTHYCKLLRVIIVIRLNRYNMVIGCTYVLIFCAPRHGRTPHVLLSRVAHPLTEIHAHSHKFSNNTRNTPHHVYVYIRIILYVCVCLCVDTLSKHMWVEGGGLHRLGTISKRPKRTYMYYYYYYIYIFISTAAVIRI